ncbi:alpha/beta hydrolase [Orenia marismortui]|uniref:Alpha-beta hydrolase superfamily lysophospholipase n=1 Tax=Orenia marismortui TaxID=46469 RepID=A0A4R8GZJ7_9FIRM|nr:alpha/beta hydrolase [Orenia marismortui]TDX52083.1 alpha-beta hydrolase superfamily lysophospholipase [Orenia marismortui]
MKNKFKFTAKDNQKIFVYNCLAKEVDIRGIVQIAHGMAEHAARYEEVASALVNNGYIVYANDHRGHGKTVSKREDLGYFAEEEGWKLVVEDFYQLTNIIKKKYPNYPIFILGHSMGSLIVRNYISKYGGEVNGVILSGTLSKQGLLGELGILIAVLEKWLRGAKNKKSILNKLVFMRYNKAFKNPRTPYDWLSRDNNQVDQYINDPLCGQDCTSAFFYDLLSLSKEVNQFENIQKIPKDLPIYLISGSKDPVGDNKKGILEIYNSYLKAGIEDIEYKFYPGGRHEILNEINKEEVFEDIINWLDNHNRGVKDE